MQTIIGLKDLREDTENYISQIERGQSFIVMRRSKPIFKLTPPEDAEEGGWETVIDFTKLKKSGVALAELLKRL